MELITLLLGATLLVAILLFLFPRNSKRARLHHLMNKIPGLSKYPIIGSTLPYIFKKNYEAWRLFLKELRKYKPLCSVWMGFMPVVSITTPQHLEEILGNSRTITKPTLYNFLHPWLGTGLLTATGSKWHSHRKMLTPSFHFKILESFVDVFSGNSKILVEKLKQKSGCGGFDVYRYITLCALDIICETAMGTSVHAQVDETSDYVASVYQIAHVVRHRIMTPWLFPDMLFRLSCSRRTQDRCLEVLHGFTNRVIQERKLHRQHLVKLEDVDQERTTGQKKRVAFLDMLLDVSEGGTKLTDEEIREEVDTFMFEGHDTTTSAVCFALFLLGLHPDIQNKAYEELLSIFQGSDRSATLKDLNKMKYLERVIKESLRLYPSVPEIGREITSDIEIGGYTVPAGASVHIHISLIHQDPDQFPNPEKFDPDNFLPEKVAKRHPFAYIPFSAGPRNCIGQKFAMLEEKTMLSYILRHYELCSLDNREDIKIYNGLILRSDEGFKMSITQRKVHLMNQ